jgi:hypothetical protein
MATTGEKVYGGTGDRMSGTGARLAVHVEK